MQTVRVEWEGPLTVDEVLELRNRNRDFGLYQIYGRHIIFGLNSLLYVGSTNKTFSQRLRNGHVGWLADEESVFLHIGRINREDYEVDRREVIKDTEALTIYWHSPPYNSSNIGTYKGQRLRVVNIGKRGSLDAEFSSTPKALGDPKDPKMLLALTDMNTAAVYEIWEENEKACYLTCLAILSEIRNDSFEETVLGNLGSGRNYRYFSTDPNHRGSSDGESVQIENTGIYVNGKLNTRGIERRTKQIAKHFGCEVELIIDDKLKASRWQSRVINRDYF